jgi:hypothetical protein
VREYRVKRAREVLADRSEAKAKALYRALFLMTRVGIFGARMRLIMYLNGTSHSKPRSWHGNPGN